MVADRRQAVVRPGIEVGLRRARERVGCEQHVDALVESFVETFEFVQLGQTGVIHHPEFTGHPGGVARRADHARIGTERIEREARHRAGRPEETLARDEGVVGAAVLQGAVEENGGHGFSAVPAFLLLAAASPGSVAQPSLRLSWPAGVCPGQSPGKASTTSAVMLSRPALASAVSMSRWATGGRSAPRTISSSWRAPRPPVR